MKFYRGPEGIAYWIDEREDKESSITKVAGWLKDKVLGLLSDTQPQPENSWNVPLSRSQDDHFTYDDLPYELRVAEVIDISVQ